MRIFEIWRVFFTLFAVILFCPACSKQSSTISLSLTAYNHTAKGIAWYSVDVPNGISGSAGFLASGAGGGGFTCCVSVPTVWRDGMTVTVTRTNLVNNVKKNMEYVVAIPKYDAKNVSTLTVHFLRNGDVRVFVTGLMLGHRDYPLKGKEAELIPGVPIEIVWP